MGSAAGTAAGLAPSPPSLGLLVAPGPSRLRVALDLIWRRAQGRVADVALCLRFFEEAFEEEEEKRMSVNNLSGTPTASFQAPAPWVRVTLGIVMIAAGIFVLGDVVVATLFSIFFIGVMAIIAGGFEIIHAFWTKGWGGFAWQILLGVLYLAFGLTLVSQPVSGALALTYIFGLLLIASGAIRIGLSFMKSGGMDWIMLLSGVFGLLAGLVILSGWPASGLWLLGALLGVDLIIHGVAWLIFAIRPGARAAWGAPAAT